MQGRVLIIAGSDSGGGAGIQADLKTVMALGGYGTTAITAVTVQDTKKVHAVHPVPAQIVAQQMSVVLDDIGADCLKTGMLHDAPLIEAIAQIIEAKAANIPLVIDPVMAAKGGHALLEENALSSLKKTLLPKASLITPNIPEAEMLLGKKINDTAQMIEAAKELMKFGGKAVLVKGGHMDGNIITDILWDGSTVTEWQGPRIQTSSTHGTGCTLASAIATGLAQGMPLTKAISRARDYVIGAIKAAMPMGHGHGPLNHGWNTAK